MDLHERVAYRYQLRRAMSYEDAKRVLGFPPGSSPSESEVQKAYRQKAFEKHPDRGGDPKEMVELNVAKDILEHKQEPDTGAPKSPGGGYYRGPEPPSWYQPESRPKQPDVKVTFDEAKNDAHIPSDIDWLFVTESMYSGYSSDEFTNSASGWVAVGQTDSAWWFVSAENHHRADHFPGGSNKVDIWKIKSHKVPKGRPADARFFYGGVMKAWKGFEFLKKRFNSKVIPAEGWRFHEKMPTGRSMSIKNFLLNKGLMEESELATPRKWTIELHYERSRDRENPPSEFFKPKWGDPYTLTLILSGKEYKLQEQDTARLDKLRISGKDFLTWAFGRYYYGGETINVTRKRDGKKVMGWMAENLHLPDWVNDALKAASA